ncbi:hypothetical protein ABU614_11400 [Lysobacter firmicutimachus]|uniref:Uncharacterized protein n=1 Tax=Lysobacter firmicutimachus TaxID=1792846 RepID=A0AAU8MYS0_9GAMM|nr:hypothetical protein [Lysobacter antibioticus]
MQGPPESAHDWTLSAIEVDRGGATATIRFLDCGSSPAALLAEGLRRPTVNRELPWGVSGSVQEMAGPVTRSDGAVWLDLCIQSGDAVCVEARRFTWLRPARAAALGTSAADGPSGPPIVVRDVPERGI